MTQLETFDSELAQSAQCLEELGEREVKSDDELKPLQTQLAANWERLKGVEGELSELTTMILELKAEVK